LYTVIFHRKEVEKVGKYSEVPWKRFIVVAIRNYPGHHHTTAISVLGILYIHSMAGLHNTIHKKESTHLGKT